jgi:hypothetical protein
MTVRRRVIALTVASAALAATAGVAVADSGASATPTVTTASPDKIVAPATDGMTAPKAKPDPADIAAIAHDLGVSVDQLNNALVETKGWLGTQTNPTEETFAAHVASLLGVSAARVLTALETHGFIVKAGHPGGGHSVDVAKVAADLGVSATQLQNALVQTKEWVAASATKATPAVLAGHLAALLGKPANVVLHVLERDGVLSGG